MSAPEDGPLWRAGERVAVEPWPRYLDDPAARQAATLALFEVTGPPRPIPSGQTDHDAQGSATRVLRIDCEPRRHPRGKGGAAPRLGEVWRTTYGLLFVATLPLPWAGWSRGQQDEPAQTATESKLLPSTLVRVLLTEPNAPNTLQVQCRRHAPVMINTPRLRAAAADAELAAQAGKRGDRVIPVTSLQGM